MHTASYFIQRVALYYKYAAKALTTPLWKMQFLVTQKRDLIYYMWFKKKQFVIHHSVRNKAGKWSFLTFFYWYSSSAFLWICIFENNSQAITFRFTDIFSLLLKRYYLWWIICGQVSPQYILFQCKPTVPHLRY